MGSSPGGTATAVRVATSTKAEQILEAAARVFVEQGYEAANMDEISRIAGVSKATVYAHFMNKEQLFATVVRNECERHSETLLSTDIDDRDLRSVLIGVGGDLLRLLTSVRGLAFYRMVAIEALRRPELARIFYESSGAIAQFLLAEFIRRAAARGQLDVPDPRLAATQFYGLLKGEIVPRSLFGMTEPPSPEAVERAVADAVDMFLRAYAARSGTSRG